MKYNVHLYATVMVTTKGVEASNQIEAIKNVCDQIEPTLHALLDDPHHDVVYVEDITGFLVDEVGDEEFKNSHHYDYLF